jgi:hypothetical protein
MSTMTRTVVEDRGHWFATVNGALGIWLIVSVFAWRHSPAQTVNGIVCGALVLAFTAATLFLTPRARWLNVILGVWLFISSFALHTAATGTAWNELFVSLLLITASIIVGVPRTVQHVT